MCNSLGQEAVIIMFDVFSRINYKNIPAWHHDVSYVNKNKTNRVALMGKKIDIPNRTHVKFHKKHNNMAYFAISYFENKNINKLLLWLLGEVFGDAIEFFEFISP